MHARTHTGRRSLQPVTSFLLTGLLALGLAACSPAPTASSTTQPTSSAAQISNTPSAVATTTAASVIATHSPAPTSSASTGDAQAQTTLSLQGDSITVNGPGVQVNGSTATITAAGSYHLSGTLNDGQLVVDSPADAAVTLIFDGVQIQHSTSAPLSIVQAKSVELVLAEGSNNQLSDGANYTFAAADTDEPNATLFSTSDLVISGTGALTVSANYNDGIASKDDLTINGGTLTVTAVDDGLRGKDALLINGGTLTVTAGGDGLKADRDDDPTKGYIAITGGQISVDAGGDGIQAATELAITAGEITLVTGGGSTASLAADQSAKGLKAVVHLLIDGGTFVLDTADDALHSNTAVTINGGDFSLAAGDDGVHADTDLTINGGNLAITRSYEGLESAAITLNDGTVTLVASDDGVNAADGTAATAGPPPPMGGPRPQPGQQPPAGMAPPAASANSTSTLSLTINGGTLVIDAGGDGLDANGSITMNDGLVIVNGPTVQREGPLDYDRGFTQNGGTLVAVGSNGMAQAPDTSSSQASVLVFFSESQAAGTPLSISTSSGASLLHFMPTKSYQSLVFSAPTLTTGSAYELRLGGSSVDSPYGFSTTDAPNDGTVYTSFTQSSLVTQVGSGGGRFR